MRRVVMRFRQRSQLREKRRLGLDMEGNAEKLRPIDLLPKLGGGGDGAVVIEQMDS